MADLVSPVDCYLINQFDISWPTIYTNEMTKLMRSCSLMLIIPLVITLFLIFFLELGSSWYIRSNPTSSAPEILVCHLDYYPVQEDILSLLNELVQKQERGEEITEHDLENVVVLAPQEDMPSLNGIVCNGMIIVSSRLQGPARLYIIRHELEHVFQLEGLRQDCQDTELCATWVGILEYPYGFISAVISSLWEAYRISPTIWDFIFSSWYVFKVYLLP